MLQTKNMIFYGEKMLWIKNDIEIESNKYCYKCRFEIFQFIFENKNRSVKKIETEKNLDVMDRFDWFLIAWIKRNLADLKRCEHMFNLNRWCRSRLLMMPSVAFGLLHLFAAFTLRFFFDFLFPLSFLLPTHSTSVCFLT